MDIKVKIKYIWKKDYLKKEKEKTEMKGSDNLEMERE